MSESHVRHTWPVSSGVSRAGWKWLPGILAVGIGLLVPTQLGQAVLIGTAVAISSVALMIRWRVAVIMLVALVPFAGLPELILRQPGWPALIKDVLFVVPAYLGFLFALARGTTPAVRLPPVMTLALGAFAAVVLVQTVHGAFISPLVALLGFKTSLWYVPLCVVAGGLFDSVGAITRFIRTLVVISIIPAASVVGAGVLVYSGYSAQLYDFYGPLAANVTQNFAVTQIDSLSVLRIPGIFPFVTQAFGFVVGMLPLAASVWLADSDRGWRRVGFGVTVLLIIAGLVGGSRSAWVWLPIEMILVFAIVGRTKSAVLLTVTCSALALLVFLGPILPAVWSFISALTGYYLVNTTGQELAAVLHAGNFVLGHGAGSETGAIRYVLPQGSTVGIGLEGWYAKTFYELGLVGLLVVLCTWLVVVICMWRARRLLSLENGRAYASASIVIVVTTMFNLVKGPFIDLDPLSVYFWFFIGLALTLPHLSAGNMVDHQKVEHHTNGRLVRGSRYAFETNVGLPASGASHEGEGSS
jgi:hypothetical protein